MGVREDPLKKRHWANTSEREKGAQELSREGSTEKNQPSQRSRPHPGGVYLRSTAGTGTVERSLVAKLKMSMDTDANLHWQTDQL